MVPPPPPGVNSPNPGIAGATTNPSTPAPTPGSTPEEAIFVASDPDATPPSRALRQPVFPLTQYSVAKAPTSAPAAASASSLNSDSDDSSLDPSLLLPVFPSSKKSRPAGKKVTVSNDGPDTKLSPKLAAWWKKLNEVKAMVDGSGIAKVSQAPAFSRWLRSQYNTYKLQNDAFANGGVDLGCSTELGLDHDQLAALEPLMEKYEKFVGLTLSRSRPAAPTKKYARKPRIPHSSARMSSSGFDHSYCGVSCYWPPNAELFRKFREKFSLEQEERAKRYTANREHNKDFIARMFQVGMQIAGANVYIDSMLAADVYLDALPKGEDSVLRKFVRDLIYDPWDAKHCCLVLSNERNLIHKAAYDLSLCFLDIPPLLSIA